MNFRTSLLCSAIALGIGLSLAPVAQAAESGDGMMKKESMMKKDGMMKKHKKHKGSMMSGDAMKKDEAPAQ